MAQRNSNMTVYISNKIAHMFGFEGFKDLLSTVFGIYHPWFNVLAATLLSINGFINKYIYNDHESIWLLYIMIGADVLLGIYVNVFKNKQKFDGAKLGRPIVVMVSYSALISFSWWMSLKSSIWIFLPGAVYGGFIGVVFYSLWRKFSAVKVIDNRLFEALEKRIKKTIITPDDEPNITTETIINTEKHFEDDKIVEETKIIEETKKYTDETNR